MNQILLSKKTEKSEIQEGYIPKGGNKYEFIIENPPYSKTLHLDFFQEDLDLVSSTGHISIIEPAMWLIATNPNSTYRTGAHNNKSLDIKKKIRNHVKEVYVENLNDDFNTSRHDPFSITYVDMNSDYSTFDYFCCGEHKTVENLDDCNLIGKHDLIESIFIKVQSYGDMMCDHIYKKNHSNVENKCFCKISKIIAQGGVNPHGTENEYTETVNGSRRNAEIYACYYNTGDVITDVPTEGYLYDTKEHLDNWKYYIYNNKLPLFLNICLTYNQNNHSYNFIPYLVDRVYKDDEINKLFRFTDDEIKFMDMIIKKFEKNSPWLRRYLHGRKRFTEEEIEKFINSLQNVRL